MLQLDHLFFSPQGLCNKKPTLHLLKMDIIVINNESKPGWLKGSWISHAFVMTYFRQLQSCMCFCQQRNLLLLSVSLLWWFEALWGPGWSAALSPVLTTGNTFKGNQTPLQWELCACHESSSTCLLIESSINTGFLLSLSSSGLYVWSCPCVVLCDSILHKHILMSHFLLLWCLSFR